MENLWWKKYFVFLSYVFSSWCYLNLLNALKIIMFDCVGHFQHVIESILRSTQLLIEVSKVHKLVYTCQKFHIWTLCNLWYINPPFSRWSSRSKFAVLKIRKITGKITGKLPGALWDCCCRLGQSKIKLNFRNLRALRLNSLVCPTNWNFRRSIISNILRIRSNFKYCRTNLFISEQSYLFLSL